MTAALLLAILPAVMWPEEPAPPRTGGRYGLNYAIEVKR